MNDSQYASQCQEQLAKFSTSMTKRLEHLPEGDSLRELAGRFTTLGKDDSDLYADGPNLVSRLFTTYPDFAPTFPRDLLWFLGGECLHYMPDDEIAAYQKLDDMRYEAAERGETLNLRDARASLLKLQ